MSDTHERAAADEAVYALTAKGKQELLGSATSLEPVMLELLVLVDGTSTAGEIAGRARTIGSAQVATVLERLAQDGLIDIVKDRAGSPDFVDFFRSAEPLAPSEEATAKAKKEAAATALSLQQQGYFVRIARRSGQSRKPAGSGTYAALVIEDEPHLASLLQHVMANEGFKVRAARNRAEIVAELRRSPLPDLVLLDVALPDADGFEVLLKMRQHPALKAVPVIMLTAKATRDAVIKGLAGGADGYITKPFQIDVLIKAVSVVLGLPGAAQAGPADQDPWSV